MNSRPVLLDLFCGAGGAAMGYHRAGFDVIGVDIKPQIDYPFRFIRCDALTVLQNMSLRHIAAIHASPPCQAHSAMKSMPDARKHPQLIEPTRTLLKQTAVPWVIENVEGAPLFDPIMLCGSMFGLGAADFQLRRHRLFESNIPLYAPGACQHRWPVIGVYGGHVRCRSGEFWRDGADFPGYDKKRLAMTAMGVNHHMTMTGLSEAIPPAYTEFVGAQIIQAIEAAA